GSASRAWPEPLSPLVRLPGLLPNDHGRHPRLKPGHPADFPGAPVTSPCRPAQASARWGHARGSPSIPRGPGGLPHRVPGVNGGGKRLRDCSAAWFERSEGGTARRDRRSDCHGRIPLVEVRVCTCGLHRRRALRMNRLAYLLLLLLVSAQVDDYWVAG